MVKLGINGFGRIGRCVYRIARARPDVTVVGVNDTADPKALAYLLQHDTVMGRLDGPVALEGDRLRVGDLSTRVFAEGTPDRLPWRELGVDVVIEATGVFRRRADLERHRAAGAPAVILTAPADDAVDSTVVLGVNDARLTPDHRVVSSASCTTTCLVPMAKVIHDAFGIEKGLVTTVHAYTNDQHLAESSTGDPDLRRSRAAVENIIPTSTGAVRAVGDILPELEGKLAGIAMRVPIPDGSTVELVADLQCAVTRGEVNDALRRSASTGPLSPYVEYSEEPIVSSDIIGNPHSCIFDAELTQVTGGRLLRVMAWYDNEWGYSCRVVDLAEKLAALARR